MFNRGIKFLKFDYTCTTNQYDSNRAEHSAFWEAEIEQLPFNPDTLVDLVGEAVPNTDFRDFWSVLTEMYLCY